MRGGANPVQQQQQHNAGNDFQPPVQYQQQAQPVKTEREALIDAFYNFDLDKDGFISVEDLAVFMMVSIL
jgi:Ca2+-binding EF-hand superfamily protein